MSGKSQLLTLPTALAIIFAASSISFAQCNSCNSVSTWPSADCGTGCGTAAGGCFAETCKAWKEEFELHTNRNSAWPLPFSCWDKASYHAVWQAQHAAGLQVAHSLTHEYFDPVTNELNRAGRAKIAWIMQTAPLANRHIYIYEDTNDESRLAKRHDSIQQIVDQWYGQMGGVNIARTQVYPNQIPATYQERISQQYRDGQPVPVIPVDSGGSITSSVGN